MPWTGSSWVLPINSVTVALDEASALSEVPNVLLDRRHALIDGAQLGPDIGLSDQDFAELANLDLHPVNLRLDVGDGVPQGHEDGYPAYDNRDDLDDVSDGYGLFNHQ